LIGFQLARRNVGVILHYNTNLHDLNEVEVDVEAEKLEKPGRRILTGTLLLTSFWCVSGLAASSTDINCSSSGSQLNSLTVSVDSLAVQPVEHLPIRAETAPLLGLDSNETVSKAVVPILHLAPHIAAILNNVFEDAADQQTDTSAIELPSAGRAAQPQKISDSVVPENVVVPGDDIARFQRQMYRKDI